MAEYIAWIALLAALLLYVVPPPWLRRQLRKLDHAADALCTLSEHAKDPVYAGQVLGHTLCHGIKRDDGGPVSVGMVLSLLIDKHGPELLAAIKPELPNLVAAFAGAQQAQQVTVRNPDGTIGPPRAQGGWSAAAKAAKAVAKTPAGGPLDKILPYIELFQQVKPLMDGMKGSGGGGSSPQPNTYSGRSPF